MVELMGKSCGLLLVLFALFGIAIPGLANAAKSVAVSQSIEQTKKIAGKVVDTTGEPIIGASILVKHIGVGTVTDIDGKFSINVLMGSTIEVSFVGYKTAVLKVSDNTNCHIVLQDDLQTLSEIVVTAMGIRKDRKSLGYAVDDVTSRELMKNKSVNAINSLAGKVAGVTITQTSGATGAGSQIILRGGTSLERDNQPLFVVDGVIYDNSTSSIGNSAYDGMTTSATTSSNRLMDINPEDIENMSILKGPAASALYGSRAAAGVVLITTKKGKEGSVEISLSAKYITSSVKSLPKTQSRYKRGFYNGLDKNGEAVVDDFTTNSWGEVYADGETAYDNIGDFFQNGGAWDTNVSISGGSKTGNFFLSGSFYDQDGIIPTTEFNKTTFRFNGEQRWKMLTFSANVAYSQARTDKTLTSSGLWGASGTGSMEALYGWARSDDMKHYLNSDGSKYRIFEGRQEMSADIENPYWMLDNYALKDDTERFTGSFSVKADITDWWWISYRMGIDSYTTENNNRIAEGAAIKDLWQNGMMSENSLRYQYLSTNLMTNISHTWGDFNFNLMLGTATDNIKSTTNYRYGWNFVIPGFYSFGNISTADKYFVENRSRRRLVGAFGEFRVDWNNTLFFTATGRNDWSSTLPIENRSYFYPSFSGSIVFTQFLQDIGLMDNSFLSFGKLRASWARVGKDANPYATTTYLENAAIMLGGIVGYGTSWSRGNPILKPEMTKSTEVGVELRFLKNRLRVDYAYYTNNSLNQIISPRGPQSTGFIFFAQNIGDVYNKGMELTISGTPILTKDWTWDASLNLYGNRGTVKNLPVGTEVLYVTDVQFGGAQAASFNNGPFLGISGYHYKYTEEGKIILNQYGMPTYDKDTRMLIGNREPKVQGGFNNTISYKNWTLNMLWEFRLGGDIYNGTDYYLVGKGLSDLTADRESLTISGAQKEGGTYKDVTYTFNANETYNLNGAKVSGKEIIQRYYTDYYYREGANYITKVNSLRLRTLSLNYELPNVFLAKMGIKRANISATANNLLLLTNYRGDPESSSAGSGISGSGATGIDYCCVPAIVSFAFGVNLTF